MNKKTQKILIVTDHYFPSENAGGPLVSIKNLVRHFSGMFDFSIFTRNHDVNNPAPFEDTIFDEWTTYENANVFYSSGFNIKKNHKIIKSFDCVYLNSFFSSLTISFLLASVFFQKKIIIAPRGEFSPNALKFKMKKKYSYILFFKLLLNKKNIIFQATSNEEAVHIHSLFPRNKLCIAQNIPDLPGYSSLKKPSSECLKLVHHSRIVPKKNLLYFLELLNNVDIKCEIEFLIYGNIEDQNYWKLCQDEIEKVSSPNISIHYLGTLQPKEKFDILSRAHIGIQPTLGENFGHSIFECFASNLPVIIGVDTPWQDLKLKEVGLNLTLNKEFDCKKLAEYLESFDIKERNDYAYNYALETYNTILKNSNYVELFNNK